MITTRPQYRVPGRLGAAPQQGNGAGMLVVLGGLTAAWMLWAWFTPHQP
jgi:hypothetical protein